MKFILLLTTTVLISIQVTSQQLISNAGGYDTAANGSISWSLGEPVTGTDTASNIILEQGFQDDVSSSFTAVLNGGKTSTFEIYPNPVMDYVIVKPSAEYVSNYQLKLYDINGRVLKTENPGSSNLYQFNIVDITPGIYFLEVITETGVTSYKILKK